MNNPSPTTMKECSCPHPHDYCDFKETICQPSEEAEKCKCHCHRGHLKDHGFNYDTCAGEYCGHCTNLSQLSEEKYTGIVRDSEGNIVEIIDNIVGVKPNSTALEWEKDLKYCFMNGINTVKTPDGAITTDWSQAYDKTKDFVQSLLASQREETVEALWEYYRHERTCDLSRSEVKNYKCTCGLSDILDKLSRRV